MQQQKSRAFYRIQATRMMIGAGNILKKHAADQARKVRSAVLLPQPVPMPRGETVASLTVEVCLFRWWAATRVRRRRTTPTPSGWSSNPPCTSALKTAAPWSWLSPDVEETLESRSRCVAESSFGSGNLTPDLNSDFKTHSTENGKLRCSYVIFSDDGRHI